MQYEILKDGEVVDTIVADAAFMAAHYKDGEYREQGTTPPPPPPTPAWEWLMDIGPFTDRLGAASVAIDVSTNPKLVAIRSDFGRRKWIDLKDPRVIAAVQYLAGQPHAVLGTMALPPLTAEQAAAVLTTPVAPAENMALRKLYFS